MDSKKSIPYLLTIIVLLMICFAVTIGYLIGTSKNNVEELNYSSPDKNVVTNDLGALNTIYNSEIEEKTTTYNELEKEKLKVQELLIELNKTKTGEQTLLKYKTQYQNLEAKMLLLVDEIAELKKNKSVAVANAKQSNLNNGKDKKANKKAPSIPSKSSNATIEKPVLVLKTDPITISPEPKKPESKNEFVENEIKITNLQAIGYKKNSATKSEVTEVASKTDFIKITFLVDGNSNEKPSEKKYYIQVIDSKNNILGNRIVEYLDDKTLTYSTLKTIVLESKSTQTEYDLYAKKFANGTYFVNVFDRSKLVAKTSFSLK